MSESQRRLKLDPEAGPLPEPEQAAELFRAFAQPLVYVDPAGPADIETLRTALMLAMMCWNIPVFEAQGSPLFEQGMRTMREVVKGVPSIVATTLRELIETRITTHARLSFLLLVEVTGTSLETASIVAQPRAPTAPKRKTVAGVQ
jgi:hypothetical protein